MEGNFKCNVLKRAQKIYSNTQAVVCAVCLSILLNLRNILRGGVFFPGAPLHQIFLMVPLPAKSHFNPCVCVCVCVCMKYHFSARQHGCKCCVSSQRRWNWYVESLQEEKTKKGSLGMSGIPAFSFGVPKQVPLFSQAPLPHIIC